MESVAILFLMVSSYEEIIIVLGHIIGLKLVKSFL
jgi:hypothetical protein